MMINFQSTSATLTYGRSGGGNPAPFATIQQTARRWSRSRTAFSIHRTKLILLVAVLTTAARVDAQLVPSERGAVAQTVDGTRIVVDYSRPRMRGRSPIYGTAVVSWNETWTPGADSATTLQLSRDVRIAGRLVPNGKYSVWAVVRESGKWTLVLDPQWRHFHTDHPDSNEHQLRFPISTRTISPVEVLTWSFDSVRSTSTTLTMAWSTRAFDVHIDITPTHQTAVSARDAAPFTGAYRYVWQDTSNKQPPSVLTIMRRGESLIGVWTPTQFTTLSEVTLIPLDRNRFMQGFMMQGELASVSEHTIWKFDASDSLARGFTITDARDSVIAKGRRR